MQTAQPTIPVFAVKLMIGFFSKTNTEAEKDALDDWINMDDTNKRIFEACLEITMRPKQHDPDTDDEEVMGPKYITDLIIKHLKHTITADEKEDLDDWLSLSDDNKKLFHDLPQTEDMEVVYRWLLKRWREEQDRMRLN